jgi:DNA-binding winged helix-turn-helix (wHTH) protein
VCFDVFEIDLQSAELRKPGSRTRLQDKSLQILTILLEHPGEVVTREELQKQLWPNGIIVDFEHSINTAVNRLRQALGDDAEHPRFIETLPRLGYRFIAPVNGRAGIAPAVAPVSSPAIAVAAMSPSQSETAVIDRRYSRRWKVLVPAALILVAAAIGGTMYFHSLQTPATLTDKDTIVLSDFINKTGDAVFDDTLKQGLCVQLEQSPFLGLLSDQRVIETLKLMGRPASDRLTPEVTREVCQRTRSTTMLTGSIVGLGSQYVIGLKAVDCNRGRTGGSAGAGGEQGSGAQGSGRGGSQRAQQTGRVAQLGAAIRHPARGSNHTVPGGAESLQPGSKDAPYDRGNRFAALLPTGGGG